MSAPDSPPSSFSTGRRWLNWLNTVLASAAVLAMVVMANYLADGHAKRFQLDRDSAFKLSAQTLRILDSLTNDVHITLFFEPHGANEEIYGLASGLLNEYERACPRHVIVQTLDYDREVGNAKEFLATNGLTGLKEKDFVLIANGKYTRTVYAKELANYDFSEMFAGRSRSVRRSAFLGELFFTADIFDVSNPHPIKAYFLQGHGENDPEDDKTDPGYGKLAAVLKDEINCDWEKLSLQGTNAVPADCALLIVAASARKGIMLPEELDKIAAYLKQGGRILALLTVSSGLESVLANWGVGVGDNRNGRILDMDKNYNLNDGTFLTAQLEPHPIMDSLASEKMPLRMVLPRPIFVANQSKIPGAPVITVLAATSPKGTNEATQQSGTFALLAAVEQGDIQGVNSPGGRGTRIVVAGDSDFLDNLVIDSVGNHAFAKLAMNWLLQRPQIMLEGLGPRTIKEYKLYMTQAQAQRIRWLFLAGLPGGVLLLGGLVWLRRRS